VARWLKSDASEIDTLMFVAHSISRASLSAAASAGISTLYILKAADNQIFNRTVLHSAEQYYTVYKQHVRH